MTVKPEDIPCLADQAYEWLRDAIVRGVLTPGMKLSERGLAVELAMSAQPVREALRRLEGEGMVETRSRSGNYVAPLDASTLIEMGRMRAALEGVAAGLAAGKARRADLGRLRACLEAMRRTTRAGDQSGLARANDRLHQSIHAIAGNALLTRSLQALRAYFYIGSPRILADASQAAQALHEHAAILAAITAGDSEAAEWLMREHALRSLAVAFPGAARPLAPMADDPARSGTKAG